MPALDRVALALNSSAIVALMLALSTQDEFALFLFSVLASFAFLTSSASILRRPATAEPAPKPLAPEATAELSAATVLDLDARLEALERREREASEADRIRQMVARGQQSAPAEPLAEARNNHASMRDRA